jgi:ketosteroid isomerase-like protein
VGARRARPARPPTSGRSALGIAAVSARKALLLRVAAALEAGDLDGVGEWFTEDFRLHDPAFPDWPGGHEGARRMLASIRDLLPGGLRVEALDMVEEGERVAARWRFSGTRDGAPRRLAVVAVYRFEGGRVAEDWGVAVHADWPAAADG